MGSDQRALVLDAYRAAAAGSERAVHGLPIQVASATASEKPFQEGQLLDAVRRALEESKRLREAESSSADAAARLATLTPREREVLDLLVAGLSNKAVANELGTSPRTIEVHRARVFEKLRAHSLPELVRLVLAAEPRRRRD
jgi:two-component system response regulator FixJ